MIRQDLWHGSHTKRLEAILPNKNGHADKIFASSSIVVAAFFTAYPRKYSFLVDLVHKRVYTPDYNKLVSNDNGGSIYRVSGDFEPASDKLIYEFEASSAAAINETEIDSAVAFVTSLGFLIFADPALHNLAYFYQEEHQGQYPKDIPEHAWPINS